MVETRIEDLIQLKLQEPEFADCFLLNIHVTPQKVLEITLDADNGITFEKCQKISRFIEAHLDENLWLGDDYGLEIGSPDAGRSLEQPRQYPKHIGRTLEVTDTDGTTQTGKLIAADAENIKIAYETVTKDGKKKIKANIEALIPYSKIKTAFVQVSFKG
jgi:ribosome maturation factor RimP